MPPAEILEIALRSLAVAGGATLLAAGDMGIGNTTIAAASYHALYGGEAEDWVGRGTGVDDEGLKRKADAVRRAGIPLAGTAAAPTAKAIREAIIEALG